MIEQHGNDEGAYKQHAVPPKAKHDVGGVGGAGHEQLMPVSRGARVSRGREITRGCRLASAQGWHEQFLPLMLKTKGPGSSKPRLNRR